MKNIIKFSNLKIKETLNSLEFEVRSVRRVPKYDDEKNKTGEFEENKTNVILRDLVSGDDFQVKVEKDFALIKEKYEPLLNVNGRKKVRLKNTTIYPYNLFKGVIQYSIGAEDLEEVMSEGDFLDEEI